jgi:hypothetical protein
VLEQVPLSVGYFLRRKINQNEAFRKDLLGTDIMNLITLASKKLAKKWRFLFQVLQVFLQNLHRS